MYHDFYLVRPDEFDELRQWTGDPKQDHVSIHDDTLLYFRDTLSWIPTYAKHNGEPFQGLLWEAQTLIQLNGALVALSIFEAWRTLLALGPNTLNLSAGFVISPEHPEGFYERMLIPRDELTGKLTKLANYARKVIESNGEWIILHRGL